MYMLIVSVMSGEFDIQSLVLALFVRMFVWAKEANENERNDSFLSAWE